MVFKALFIAHAPDADPTTHKCEVETLKYKLFVRLVKSQQEALEVSKQLVNNEGVQAIILCPGFTHKDVAEIYETLGSRVSVSVARGDGPSNVISMKILEKEGWFASKPFNH